MLASTVMAEKQVSAVSAVESDFEPFVADAVVSLAGSGKKVPIKILRDTGAKHSFIVESVLPVSHESEMGISLSCRAWNWVLYRYLVITLSVSWCRALFLLGFAPRCLWMA